MQRADTLPTPGSGHPDLPMQETWVKLSKLRQQYGERSRLELANKKEINSAWEVGKPIRGKNPEVWRKDPLGNTIRKPSYGTQGEYGWEVDHKRPTSKGGSDSPRNLQPMHWKKNREKSDKYPYKKGK